LGRPGIAWALPGVAFFVFFAVAPMALVAYLSLTRWDGLDAPRFTGLANWSRLAGDEVMQQAVVLSLVLTVVSWAVQTPIALLLGVWAAGRQRNRAVLSAVFFVPLLLSSAAVALLWRSLFDPNFGLPLGGLDVLGTQRSAFAAVVFVAGWQFIPFHALLYQAGTRNVPQSLYQAATVDGAGTLRQFLHITLPQLRNTIATSSVLMVVGSLTFFDTVLILTRGGPGTDTTIVPYLMYRTGFVSFEMGYASAIALTLVVVATAISTLLVKVSGFGKMRSTLEGL
jgi:xylobiose transport system permease protein